jgi:hypothetical protein
MAIISLEYLLFLSIYFATNPDSAQYAEFFGVAGHIYFICRYRMFSAQCLYLFLSSIAVKPRKQSSVAAVLSRY